MVILNLMLLQHKNTNQDSTLLAFGKRSSESRIWSYSSQIYITDVRVVLFLHFPNVPNISVEGHV